MRLYHFLSQKNAIDDLVKKRVKISIIDKLNDPFELQAGFTKPNKKIRTQFSQFKSDISKDVGIFCCSKDWRNPLLWSHYADKHTGIALGLDIPDRAAIEVKYSEERPLLTLSSKVVTPVKTGVPCFCKASKSLDSGFHRNDDSWAFSTFYRVVIIHKVKFIKKI
jgi:hypothetical protein